jgi:hypothetical protein
MYCPQCGGANHDSLRYCVTCGFDLDEYRHRWQEGSSAVEDDASSHDVFDRAGDPDQGYTAGHQAQQYQPPSQQSYQEPYSSYGNQYSQEQYRYGYSGRGPVPHIPSYMGWAIATLILCFWPTGIVAVVYASQVNNKLAYGDYEGARESSRKAKMWSWISFAISLAAVVIVMLFALAAGLTFSTVY